MFKLFGKKKKREELIKGIELTVNVLEVITENMKMTLDPERANVDYKMIRYYHKDIAEKLNALREI